MIWVRSQNKEVLVEVENLAIFSKEGSYEIHSYTECLGKYSTKEKALKVLDMIQEKIERRLNNELFVNCRTRSDRVTFVNSPAFQMPQDDEVKDDG